MLKGAHQVTLHDRGHWPLGAESNPAASPSQNPVGAWAQTGRILGPDRTPLSPQGYVALSCWVPAPALLHRGRAGLQRSPPTRQVNYWRAAGASAGSGVINREVGVQEAVVGARPAQGGGSRGGRSRWAEMR